ncbi:MAG: hypothetical protein AAB929_05505 [Patescibacteria group bacterium]
MEIDDDEEDVSLPTIREQDALLRMKRENERKARAEMELINKQIKASIKFAEEYGGA